jgi:hypothetical protein
MAQRASTTSSLVQDTFAEALAKLQQSLAPPARTTSKDTTATAAAKPVPRIRADSPLGQQLIRAMQQVAAVAGTQDQPAPRRPPSASELGEMRAGAAEATAAALPGLAARLEAEQQRRRQAKGLPAYARGGVVRARSTAKAAAAKKTSASRSTSRASTASRAGTRRSPARSATNRTSTARASRSSTRASSSRGGSRGRR